MQNQNKKLLLKKKFNLTDQICFGKISGDINPIHSNEIYSRRSLYGEVIVHGINVVLIAINNLKKKNNDFDFDKIKTKFIKPIYLNENVNYYFKILNRDCEITVYQNRTIKTKININVINSKKSFRFKNLIHNKRKKILQKPNNLNFNKLINRFKLNLYFDYNLFDKYYSHISDKCIYNSLYLISLSYFVGMVSPGLNSIFSTFNIQISKNNFQNFINFFLHKKIVKFNYINYDFCSNSCKGNLEIFLRPKKIRQKPYNFFTDIVSKNLFSNHRALVLGGSRGLGEISVKILRKGGADVDFTYFKSKYESELISKQSGANFFYLDLNEKNFNKINLEKYTHIFYFLSPKIFKDKDYPHKKLINNYDLYFCKGLKLLLKRITDFNITLFYPSTIFIEDSSIDYKIYSDFKLKSEIIIKNFKKQNKLFNYFIPRLPPLKTDQNISLLNNNWNNSEKILFEEIIKILDSH